jgi:DNA-binding NarL/FixJ family response regulator
METLSIDDIQKLNQGIQQLYNIHNFDTFGVDTLAIVDRLVPSDVPLFHVTNTRTGRIYQTFLPTYSGLSSELLGVLERVLSQDRLNHPIAQHMPKTLNGAHKLSDFIDLQELHSRENLYQNFLRHIGTEDQMLFFIPDVNPAKWCELARVETILSGFILCRPNPTFTERDRLILNLFQPHLLQAYTNARCHQQVQQDLNRLQQSFDNLGVAIVDLDGKIQSIAPQVILWLDTYFAKSTHSFQLPELLRSWMNYQVNSFCNNPAIVETPLPLRIQKSDCRRQVFDQRELTIRLVIEKPGETYMLLFQEQMLSLPTSLELLGLTQREVDVLLCMMQGKDNQVMATTLDIKIGTVRKHLENIYRKLNVQSRTAAISRVLEQIGFLPSNPMG